MAQDSATRQEQFDRIASGKGFIAALDQSGGSTPKALRLYGVDEDAYSGDDEMFAKIHEMRSRIVTSDAFTGDRLIGAILFEKTMDSKIQGVPSATFLWDACGVVPFLKVDKGLADEANGAQVMKPMPDLDALLAKANAADIFGTKMRSVIKEANVQGIKDVVAQQFEVGRQIVNAGLVPIIEPEVVIHSATKAEAEEILRDEIKAELDQLPSDSKVSLKLTIPTQAGLYDDLADHPNVVRIVALSGGYSTDQACSLLAQNSKMIASFSRALAEGLNAQMTDAEFDAALGSNISQIYEASL